MPLRQRLLLLVAMVLAFCLVAGGALTYWQALRKIELEMSSAIEVGDSAVEDALSTLGSTDASTHLHRLVASFNGDRHLKATLVTANGTIADTSRVKPPVDPAPDWLYRLLVGTTHTRDLQLPQSLASMGKIVLEADPHNEVGEVWEDLKLKFVIIFGFCAIVLAAIYATLGRALRPLEDFASALSRVGQGDYTAHVAEKGPRDLAQIYRSFNTMADQLNASEQQNRRLNEQLSSVQEEERAEIARDLHDEIGPFLFAVDVDAQSIPMLLDREKDGDVAGRAKSIRQSVQHMQTHLRGILSRLRPAMFIDQGLTHAVEQLVAFWRLRRPNIEFDTDIDDGRFPARIEEAAFRILQEGTSNAVRHGSPTKVGLRAKKLDGALEVLVSDDGSGIAAKSARGFGLIGMNERVNLLGGKLTVSQSPSQKGVTLIAQLPLRTNNTKHHAAESDGARTGTA